LNPPVRFLRHYPQVIDFARFTSEKLYIFPPSG
jgi:hypothetical protein